MKEVGCQNYDDQFDSLNDKIVTFPNQVSSIQTIQLNFTALEYKLFALACRTLTDENLATIAEQLSFDK